MMAEDNPHRTRERAFDGKKSVLRARLLHAAALLRARTRSEH